MKQRLIDFLMVLACIAIILLALWFMPCIESAEQETEPAETELTTSPCPDVVLMVAPEPTTMPEPTSIPDPDKPAYNPAVPLSENLQCILWAACEENGVEPALALGLIEVESGFDPSADNGLCYGLMQLNRKYFPSGLPPGENIQHGVRYLTKRSAGATYLPTKQSRARKIDGFAALLNAHTEYLRKDTLFIPEDKQLTSYVLSLLDFRVNINAKPMARGYIVFEPEDWDERELRIPQEIHGLEPAASACVCSVRMRVGRNARELEETDVAGICQTILDAVTEANNANGAQEDSKPYPPDVSDGHIPLTWEQIQYFLLEAALVPDSVAAGQADDLGFGAWKERDNGATATITLDELMKSAYLAVLAEGAGAMRDNFDALCTLETLQGLRFRVEASGPRYIKIDGQGYAAKYDMDGIMRKTWGSMGAENNAYMDLETKELVISYKTPFPGDVLVIG